MTDDVDVTITRPNVPLAIAAIDEAIILEDDRVHTARADLADAQLKLEKLHAAREQLADLVELYTGTAPPPPVARDVSDHTNGNGNGHHGGPGVGDRRRAQRQKITDEQLVDAVRALGGHATLSEVAGALGANAEAVRRKLNVLVESDRLNVEPRTSRTAAIIFTIPAPQPGSPDAPDPTPGPSSPEGSRSPDASGPASSSETSPSDATSTRDDSGQLDADELTPPAKPSNGSRELAPGESKMLDDAVSIADVATAIATNGAPEAGIPARTSPNLSRLPKREAPSVSAATRRAMKAPPKPPVELGEQLLSIMGKGAKDARWKVPELIRALARDHHRATDTEKVGHELGRLKAAGKVHREADWWALA